MFSSSETAYSFDHGISISPDPVALFAALKTDKDVMTVYYLQRRYFLEIFFFFGLSENNVERVHYI